MVKFKMAKIRFHWGHWWNPSILHKSKIKQFILSDHKYLIIWEEKNKKAIKSLQSFSDASIENIFCMMKFFSLLSPSFFPLKHMLTLFYTSNKSCEHTFHQFTITDSFRGRNILFSSWNSLSTWLRCIFRWMFICKLSLTRCVTSSICWNIFRWRYSLFERNAQAY